MAKGGGDTLPDAHVADAVEAAAARISTAWGVATTLRRIDRAGGHAEDDLVFMPMGGRGGTHTMAGRWRDRPQQYGDRGWRMLKVGHANLQDSALRFAAAVMGDAAREEKVGAALERAGLEPTARPAWAHAVHPVARAIIEHRKADKERLVHASAWIERGEIDIWGRDDEIPGLTGTRYGWKIEVGAKTLTEGDALDYEDKGARATLTVRAQLPHSVVTGLRGKPLCKILDHPALCGVEAKVNSARQIPEHLILNLASRETALEDPPNGIVPDWLNLQDVVASMKGRSA